MKQKYINIFTVLFVIGTVIFVLRANDNLQPALNNLKAGYNEIKNFILAPPVPVAIPGTPETVTPNTELQKSLPPVVAYKETATEKVVLPGPLEKKPVGTKIGILTTEGVITETNAERGKTSARLLVESAKLDASAQLKANDILTKQYFEHVSPDGKSVSDLVRAEGYEYLKVGENLALGNFTSDADVVNAWMNSPGHRANILDPSFADIGIGIAHGLYKGNTVYVVVQHFGRPVSECPKIDDSIRTQVEVGQNQLNTMATNLNNLATEIEKGEAAGQNMNSEIEVYNADAATYREKFTEINNLRVEYNTSVEVFNACASS